MKSTPAALIADADGNIIEREGFSMLGERNGLLFQPRQDELIPLPPESEIFLLPGRNAIGYNRKKGCAEAADGVAVASAQPFLRL